MRIFGDIETVLAERLAMSIRGPKRHGLFAVFLFVKIAGDLFPPVSLSERSNRKRVQALERRLSSLSLPPALRRGLGVATRLLREGSPQSAQLALQHVATVARETLGPKAGEALSEAVGLARDYEDIDVLTGPQTVKRHE